MRSVTRKKLETLLGLTATTVLAAGLVGCFSDDPLVKLVKTGTFSYNQAITVEQMLTTYPACKDKKVSWDTDEGPRGETLVVFRCEHPTMFGDKTPKASAFKDELKKAQEKLATFKELPELAKQGLCMKREGESAQDSPYWAKLKEGVCKDVTAVTAMRTLYSLNGLDALSQLSKLTPSHRLYASDPVRYVLTLPEEKRALVASDELLDNLKDIDVDDLSLVVTFAVLDEQKGSFRFEEAHYAYPLGKDHEFNFPLGVLHEPKTGEEFGNPPWKTNEVLKALYQGGVIVPQTVINMSAGPELVIP